MTTEDNIKEAFEAQYGSRNEWRDMWTYDAAWEDFRSGYLACLNGLEQQLKDAERYRWLCRTLESAKGSGSIDVNRELAYYETPEQGKQVRIQWYPDTPIGFYVSEAETINDAIDNAMKE